MVRVFSIALALILLKASPAYAVDFFEQRGGWDIVGTDKTCGMSMSYEGPGATELHLLMDDDDPHSITLTNHNWSIKEDELYELVFRIDDVSYEKVDVAGIRLQYKPGFLALAGDGFVEKFAKGNTLYVYLGEKLVDQLSLKGTAVALQSLRRCTRLLKADLDAKRKEEERWAHLSGDPFAEAQPPTLKGPTNPEPRNSPGFWVSSNDFPTSAVREGRGGRVGFEVEVSSMGRVTLCRITSTSGHADLDEAACKAVTRRARFRPATNEDGDKVAGKYLGTINWTLPEPEPEPTKPVYVPAQ